MSFLENVKKCEEISQIIKRFNISFSKNTYFFTSGIKNFPTNAIWTRNDVCKKSNGLTWRQTRFCQRQFPWMLFTKNAAKDTVDECQTVLKHHDWNCQSIDKAPAFNTDLKKGKQNIYIYI